MVIPETVNREDPWETRVATALALQNIAPLLSTALVEPIFAFLVNEQALGDRHGGVRRSMLDAGIAIIDLHGGQCIASLMKTFEDYLGGSGGQGESADYVKEAVVIVSGSSTRILTCSYLVDSLDTLTLRMRGSPKLSTGSLMRSTPLPSLFRLLSPTACPRLCTVWAKRSSI